MYDLHFYPAEAGSDELLLVLQEVDEGVAGGRDRCQQVGGVGRIL